MRKSFLIILLFFILVLKIKTLSLSTNEISNDPSTLPEERYVVSPPELKETLKQNSVTLDFYALEKKLNNQLSHFPTNSDLKFRTSEELHRPPRELIRSAEQIGHLVDEISKNPQYAPLAMDFLFRCAAKEELLATLRAVCLRNGIDMSKKHAPHELNEKLQHFAPEIKELALSLPSNY